MWGFQFRSVTCRSAKEKEEGKLLGAEACTGERPLTERDCNLGPCEGLRFVTSEWQLVSIFWAFYTPMCTNSKCQKCNDTEETRKVNCVDKNAREYPLEKCLDGKKLTKIPEDTRPCASQAVRLFAIVHFDELSFSRASTNGTLRSGRSAARSAGTGTESERCAKHSKLGTF